MLRRSTATALVVGTILTAINQGTHIVAGVAGWELAWKAPLTYCVPFLVATWGALGNAAARPPAAPRAATAAANGTAVLDGTGPRLAEWDGRRRAGR